MGNLAVLIFKSLLQRATALALLCSSFFVAGSGNGNLFTEDTFLTPVILGGTRGLGAAFWLRKLFR